MELELDSSMLVLKADEDGLGKPTLVVEGVSLQATTGAQNEVKDTSNESLDRHAANGRSGPLDIAAPRTSFTSHTDKFMDYGASIYSTATAL